MLAMFLITMAKFLTGSTQGPKGSLWLLVAQLALANGPWQWAYQSAFSHLGGTPEVDKLGCNGGHNPLSPPLWFQSIT